MKTFNIPPDAVVVTSSYVTRDALPILEVSHEDDEEGGSLWQFHCGNGDYSMEKMELVRLDTILGLDPTIREVSNLQMGKEARRRAVGSRWIVSDARRSAGE